VREFISLMPEVILYNETVSRSSSFIAVNRNHEQSVWGHDSACGNIYIIK